MSNLCLTNEWKWAQPGHPIQQFGIRTVPQLDLAALLIGAKLARWIVEIINVKLLPRLVVFNVNLVLAYVT